MIPRSAERGGACNLMHMDVYLDIGPIESSVVADFADYVEFAPYSHVKLLIFFDVHRVHLQ